MDRVTGPFDGHFVASSATEIGGRYLGFAKVCCQRPRSFWLATLCEEPGCCAHLCGGGLFDTADAALASAELIAQQHLRSRVPGRADAVGTTADASGRTARHL